MLKNIIIFLLIAGVVGMYFYYNYESDTIIVPEESGNGDDELIIVVSDEENEKDIIVQEESPPPVVEPEKSLTEKYLIEFNEKAEYYSFDIDDPNYGKLSVFRNGELTKYMMKEFYLEVENNRKLTKSNFRVGTKTPTFLDVQQEEYRIIDYVWEIESTGAEGCYQTEGYLEEHCAKTNYSDEEPRSIIYTDLFFSKKITGPEEWLQKFNGIEPILVEENRRFKARLTESIRTVDYVYFENNDGTQTKLFIDQTLKIPFKIEIIKDKKVIETIEFNNFKVNDPEIRNWNPEFLKQ